MSQRDQIEQALVKTEIAVSVVWGEKCCKTAPDAETGICPRCEKLVVKNPQTCRRCKAPVALDDRAKVECTGANVRGCVQCIGPVVASYASYFRTNDLETYLQEPALAKSLSGWLAEAMRRRRR